MQVKNQYATRESYHICLDATRIIFCNIGRLLQAAMSDIS